MKDKYKLYKNKNKITGVIALILICLFFANITYGISIIILVICLIYKIKKNKYIKLKKEEIKNIHDKINKGE